jgi:hypothetical protein
MKKRVWKYWCKAIGSKEFEDDRQADVVAVIRTIWVLLHIVTCLAIITNAIANHGWGLIGL